MKIVVLYENSGEKTRAENLVNVLKTIGNALVYGKVRDGGVQLENWANQPPTKIEAVSGPSPDEGQRSPLLSVTSGEFQYLDAGPAGPGYYYGQMAESISREFARRMVRMFPDSAEAQKRSAKPVVPKPDTTVTGVTVRDLDIWDDDHE